MNFDFKNSLPLQLMRPVAASLLGAALLAGCANPGGIAPQAELRSPQSLGASEAPASQAAWLHDNWWRAYGDATLSQLIEQALQGSPSVRVAQARLGSALAQAQAAGAVLMPQVGAQLQSTRERMSEHYIYPQTLAGHMVSDNLLRLGASWELDLWGRDRAALDAAVGAGRAADADLAAARWYLSTQVAKTYVQLARLQDLRDVAQSTLTQREQTNDLVKDRVKAGLDTQVELRQSEGAIPQTRQDIEAINEQIALTRNTLALLVGSSPQAMAGVTPHLQALSSVEPPAVIPADLIGRRPDVVGARWRVEASLKGVDAARAAFYPNVNLAAFAGFHSLGAEHFLSGGSREFGITPAVSLPIFEGGRLRAELRGRAADADAAVETYNFILSSAVRDVADSIASQESLRKQAVEQQLAQAAAEGAYDLAMTRYRAGLGTYLTVLSAETAVLNQRRQAAELKSRALDLQINLVRALGGGYVGEQPGATTVSSANPQ